jgi:hypothetical protein
MNTQLASLKEVLAYAEEKYGPDAFIVKQLKRQIDGYNETADEEETDEDETETYFTQVKLPKKK